MTTLTHAQVDAYRLKAHHLEQPAPRKMLHDVVNHLGGSAAAGNPGPGDRLDELGPISLD